MTKSALLRRVTIPLLPLLAAILLMLTKSGEDAARSALLSCANVLIPSLFPYMVISSLIMQSSAAETLGKPLAPAMRRLFRLPGCSAGPWILGALCGFPVGARAACELYDRGEISLRDAARLVALANNTGPAFVIGVVGITYWHSRTFGVVLFAAQLLSSIFIGMIFSPHESPGKQMPHVGTSSKAQLSLTTLANAVSGAATSMLVVCGFVVFFAVVSDLIHTWLNALSIEALSPWIAAMLEFSTGCAKAAQLGGVPGAFIAGCSIGWSGLSVFAQCACFCAPRHISLRPALFAKCIQGILSGILAALYFAFFGTASVSASTAIGMIDFPSTALYVEIALLMLFCLIPPLPGHK